MTEFSVIEICAGAGGQALGLELAGFKHVMAVELDPMAIGTLKLNGFKEDDGTLKIGEVANLRRGDVADPEVFNPWSYTPEAMKNRGERPIDLFAGGVPCPPFSIAGKQLGANDERDLFAWAIEQVDIIKPRAVLLENVRGLSMPRFAAYRQHVLDQLSNFGYAADWKLIQASEHGVPQLRPRFVLVAMRAADFEYFQWPDRTGKVVTVGEALGSLMAENGWADAREWAKNANKIAPTIVGGSKKHGGADLGPTRAKRAWAELGVDALGVHDTAPPYPDSRPMTELGPKLTVEMVARLQGWLLIRDDAHKAQIEAEKPEGHEFAWRFAGKKTAVYRQIGNAFPPPVARALGLSIARALRHEGIAVSRDVSASVDPIYRVLRDQAERDRSEQNKRTYLSAAQIARKAELELPDPEIDRRISLIDRDFHVDKRLRGGRIEYMLGDFKAFTGQEDHARHTYYRENLSRVS